MAICAAAIMCHAPIAIPEIAGARARECALTTRAMGELARTMVAHEPELMVVISPHMPRRGESWGVVADAVLQGSFARFGYPELSHTFVGEPDQARAICAAAKASGLDVRSASGQGLDHGAMVPLNFLREAGYQGPLVAVALPYPGSDTELAFGEALRAASDRSAQRWSVLASGDMSHRLTPGAPAGFDERAAEFDQAFVECVRAGNVRGAIELDPQLVELAAEDVVQSTAVAGSAVRFETEGLRVYAYEGPFGVGYLEALLYSDRAVGAR